MFRVTPGDKCHVCGESVGADARIGQWGYIVGPLCIDCQVMAHDDTIFCATSGCLESAVVLGDDPDVDGVFAGWCAAHKRDGLADVVAAELHQRYGPDRIAEYSDLDDATRRPWRDHARGIITLVMEATA